MDSLALPNLTKDGEPMMRRLIPILFILLIMSDAPGQADTLLFYHEPARTWEEALPLGNGRLGAMPGGQGTHRE